MTRIKYQYIATLCANFATISYGIALGWASPTIPILLSNESPLKTGPITNDQASWIISLLCFGGVLGALLFGWSADRIGRKKSILLCGIPQLISWLLISFGTNPYYLFVSRFLTGFTAGGIFLLIPLYVSEISADRIRGQLGCALILSYNGGILIGYVIGEYLNYFIVPLIGVTFTTIFIIGFLYLPETSQYLVIRERYEEAEKSFIFYGIDLYDNNNDGNDNDDDDDSNNINGVKTMQSTKSKNFLMELKKLKETSLLTQKENGYATNIKNNISIQDFKTKSTKKGILIAIVLIFMTQFCGIFALLNYTSDIFRNAGSTLEPNVCAIIVAVIQLCGSYFSTVLVERLGRKILLILSSLGTGFGLTTMGIYFYLKSNGYVVTSISWLPLVSLSEIVFIACLGIIPLAYIVTTEVLPQKLRSVVPSTFMILLWGIAFLFIKYFNDLVQIFELHGCMWFFAGCCYFQTIFVIFVLPETKGKSTDAIISILQGDK